MENAVSWKRQKEETQLVLEKEYCNESKKHKSYNHILSLLESEEEAESTEDLSPFMTSLQKELSADSYSLPTSSSLLQELNSGRDNPLTSFDTSVGYNSASLPFSSFPYPTPSVPKERDQKLENDQERVMRHLLEASDDELGIPSVGDDELVHVGDVGLVDGGGESFPVHDTLWELDDQTWLYYSSLIQTESFV